MDDPHFLLDRLTLSGFRAYLLPTILAFGGRASFGGPVRPSRLTALALTVDAQVGRGRNPFGLTLGHDPAMLRDRNSVYPAAQVSQR
jgi:hypothetical protein